MKIKEFTGKTTQEAIDNGLAELGVTIADVHVDVLQEGAKGLFGLFGSKPACVRLTVMEDERVDDHGEDADGKARHGTVGKAADHGRHQRGVIAQKRRRGENGDLHIHEDRTDGAHECHGDQLLGPPLVGVLKLDMRRLLRHEITCLFHPDSNRWHRILTGSACRQPNA